MSYLEQVLDTYVALHDDVLLARGRARAIPAKAHLYEYFAVHRAATDTVVAYDVVRARKYVLSAPTSWEAGDVERFLRSLMRIWHLPTTTKKDLVEKMQEIATLLDLFVWVTNNTNTLKVNDYYYATIYGLKPVVLTSDGSIAQVLIPSRKLRFNLRHHTNYWSDTQLSLTELDLLRAILDFMF